MSVIVKGVDVPGDCDGCWHPTCNLWIQTVAGKRHKDCPISPMPEKHGRLGDLDLLQASFRESIEECRKWCKGAEEKGDDELVLIARQSLNTFVEACLRTKSMETIVEKED